MKIISDNLYPLAINAGKRWANSGRKLSSPMTVALSSKRHFHKVEYITPSLRGIDETRQSGT